MCFKQGSQTLCGIERRPVPCLRTCKPGGRKNVSFTEHPVKFTS